MREIKVTLLYPPEQTWPGSMCKPNGSLAYPMLGGALREAGIEVNVFDACVGNEKDDLHQTFYTSVPLPSGMFRTGTTDERILEEIENSDIIGITSIFSHQETMVLNTIKLIKKHYPNKLVVTGGVNARHRTESFFDAGTDIICTSEAEKTIVDIARVVQKGTNDFSTISKIIFKHDENIHISKVKEDIIWDLDFLPMPA
jgi:Fe-S oxidoreductase